MLPTYGISWFHSYIGVFILISNLVDYRLRIWSNLYWFDVKLQGLHTFWHAHHLRDLTVSVINLWEQSAKDQLYTTIQFSYREGKINIIICQDYFLFTISLFISVLQGPFSSPWCPTLDSQITWCSMIHFQCFPTNMYAPS
jgi:hypothetical protein